MAPWHQVSIAVRYGATLLVSLTILLACQTPRTNEPRTAAAVRAIAVPRPQQATRLFEEAEQRRAERRYDAAAALYQKALAILLAADGQTHPDVPTIMNNLATVYLAQQKYDRAESLYREALEIQQQTLDDAHPNLATTQHNLAAVYFSQGRYGEAETLYRQALSIKEQALGQQHPQVALVLHHLGELHATQERYAQAETYYRRALLMREQTLGSDHVEVAASLHGLAEVYRAQGAYGKAEAAYQRALLIREQMLDIEHPDVATSNSGLARLYYHQGRYHEAEVLYQRAIPILEQTLGQTHGLMVTSLVDLASIYYVQGRYHDAEPLYQRAIRLRAATLGANHPEVASLRMRLATVYHAQGRYAAAEQLDRQALAILHAQGGTATPDMALALRDLAVLARHQGQYREAEALYQQALTALRRNLGATHPQVATVMNSLAGLQRDQGRYDLALPLYQEALTLRERVLGPNHPEVADSLHDLASLYQRQQQHDKALSLYQRALAIREEVLGPDHPNVATSLVALADVYRRQGRHAEAEALYRRALTMQDRTLGANHPDMVVTLYNLATLLASRHRGLEALPLYERGRRMLLAVSRMNADLDDATLKHIQQRSEALLRAYLTLLVQLVRQDEDRWRTPAMALEAFRVAEQLRGGAVQADLARAAARMSTYDSELANLAQQAQLQRHRRREIRETLTALYATAPSQRDKARLAQLQAQERTLDQALAHLAERLSTAFPHYADLTVPEPIDTAAVTSLLQAGEAVVSFYTLDNVVLVWLIRPDQPPRFETVAMARDDLKALVTAVRTSLDQETNPGLVVGRLLPFDIEGAHRLYRRLLAPLRTELDGVTHLFVVPDEILMPVPFASLVTGAAGEAYQTLLQHGKQPLTLAAAEMASYADLPWLMQDHALTVLPTATSLRALRQRLPLPGRPQERLIGFGDPVLTGPGGPSGNHVADDPAVQRLDAVRQLPALPGTREELERLAQVLGVNPHTSLYLGPQATETQLRQLNASGRLATTQVLSFATHGLIRGDIAWLTQPALVLTPPRQASRHDDGLLSLDEVLELHLPRTEWVILSACNTAASDDSGEGLSGLVRAFFFAGAQSVLVSHWSVDDRATQALISEVFRRYANDPTMPQAEALRQGMRAVVRDAHGSTAYFAHPFAWAPFFLVGEGHKATRR
jgi:tetratricopeptide (TPR) repeat protein